MKRIAKKKGADTDTSKDYDYTDWPAVSFFVSDFIRDINLTNYSDKKAKPLAPFTKPTGLKPIQY